MAPHSDGLLLVRRPAQLDVLVSPLRQELLEEIQAGGPGSVAELAGRLGRKPQALYHHVKKLAAAGILVEGRPRRLARHTQAVWKLAATRIGLAAARPAPNVAEALTRSVRAILRRAERNFARSVQRGSGLERAGQARLLAAYGKLCLRPRELARFLGLLADLQREVERLQGGARASADRARRPDGREDYLWTMTFAPLAPRAERARKPGRRRSR